MWFGNSIKISKGSVPVLTLLLAGNDYQLHLKKVKWALQDPVQRQAK